MTPEEIARDIAISKANAPTAADLEFLARLNAEILASGLIFQPNENLLQEMVKQAQERALQQLP